MKQFDSARLTLRAASLFVALAHVAAGPVSAQPPAAGLVDSPCAAPDPAAAARLEAMIELNLKPAAPAEYQRAVAAAQAALPAGPPPDVAAMRVRDWPNLCRYKADNALLADRRPAVVFMGDSITEGWVPGDPALFSNGVVGRGIGGQTSPQMLLRFRQDVVDLHPRVVHIMAGTNDIAGNTGPTTVRDFQRNILAMIDLARANDIAVVLAGIPPSRSLYWRDNLDPRPFIRPLNEWLRTTAEERGLTYVDYAEVLADTDGGLRADFSNDGVHPNRAGYAAMRPLAQQALAVAALARASGPGVPYSTLYIDSDGESHFRDGGSLDLVLPSAAERADGDMFFHTMQGVASVMLTRLKAGMTEDWHASPQRMFVFGLGGEVEMSASDGTTRVVGSGDMLLLEDTSGKGHLTHVPGDVDYVGLGVLISDP